MRASNRKHGEEVYVGRESPSEGLGEKKDLEKILAQLELPCVRMRVESRCQQAWGRRGRGCCKG